MSKKHDNPIFGIYQAIILDIKHQLDAYKNSDTVPFEKIIMNSIYKYQNIVGCKVLGIGDAITDTNRCPITSIEEYLSKIALQDLMYHVTEVNAYKGEESAKNFSAQMAIDRIDHIIDRGFCNEAIEKLGQSIVAIETIETLGSIVMDNISPGLAEEYRKALEIVKENLNTNIY